MVGAALRTLQGTCQLWSKCLGLAGLWPRLSSIENLCLKVSNPTCLS